MTSTNPISNGTEVEEQTPPTSSDTPPEVSDAEDSAEVAEHPDGIFQAVGVIIGEVNLDTEGKSTITFGRSTYQLFYIPKKRRVFEALKKEIEATGEHTQRLLVYPKVIHFPRKEQPHQIAFQLVGFDKGREEEAISSQLEDFEFKFCGLWQFIPVCPTPCISVFRNFTHQRLEFIKQAEPAKKVKFMKASHIPLFWRDSPVRPFRFNPKAEGDQGHPAFVQVKAKFLPQRNVFGFFELLAEPQENAPKFLKASKKDKATLLEAKKKEMRGAAPTSAPTSVPTPKPKQPIPLPKKVVPEKS
jgi:hypothetical protein